MGDNGPPVVERDHWCRTTGDKASTTFTWTIEDFLNRQETNGEFILSSTFCVSGPNDKKTNWALKLFPRGEGEDDEDTVGLFLSNIDDTKEKICFSLSFFNERHQKEMTREVTTEDVNKLYQEGYTTYGHDNMISLEDLEDSPDLLPDGNLTVVCDLTVYGPEATLSGSKIREERTSVDNCLKQMSEHFGIQFGNKNFSDVKIISGNEEFHCHRIVLSARSPVFEAMFRSDMIENNSEEVSIQDIDPEVVREILHFIYTGAPSTETVMEEIGKELLGAAEMYQLDLLKNKCEEKLCSSLDVSNSVELLVLADLHQASKLRSMALSLVARNMDTIVNTDVYKEFIPHHPALALEITKALVQKAGIKRKRDNNE